MAHRRRRFALIVMLAAAAVIAALALVRSRSGTSPSRAAASADGPWCEPVDGRCPDGFPVKVSRSGIYHVVGGRSYDRTAPERCYATAEAAEADGYRRAKV